MLSMMFFSLCSADTFHCSTNKAAPFLSETGHILQEISPGKSILQLKTKLVQRHWPTESILQNVQSSFVVATQSSDSMNYASEQELPLFNLLLFINEFLYSSNIY